MTLQRYYPWSEFRAIEHVSWWHAMDMQAQGCGHLPVDPADLRQAHEKDRQAHHQLMLHEQQLGRALVGFLNERRGQQALPGLKLDGDAMLWPVMGWNAWLEGRPTIDSDRLWAHLAGHVLTHHLLDHYHRPGARCSAWTEKESRRVWGAVCRDLEGGCSQASWGAWGVSCPDPRSGVACQLEFDRWRPVLHAGSGVDAPCSQKSWYWPPVLS